MLGSVFHHMDYQESPLADDAIVVGESKKDTHCSDKCCGSDVKREDCKCPPSCKHCNCNDPKVDESKIYKDKLKAKLEGREVKEGEFNDKVACAAACSSGAMKFGDINEKDSEIYKLKENDRAYHLLDTVGTKPNVVYQVKVRNNKNS